MSTIEPKVHYVKNKDLTAALRVWREKPEFIEWKKRKVAAKEAKEPFSEIPPQTTEYIAQCFYMIAKKYAKRPNWSGYTYVEDMVSEGAYLCIRYAHNFDPDKSNNAFSYFTQICHNAFLQQINRENKFAKFKFQLVKENNAKLAKMDFNDINLHDEDNSGFATLESEKEETETTEPDYSKIADNVAKETAAKEAAAAKIAAAILAASEKDE